VRRGARVSKPQTLDPGLRLSERLSSIAWRHAAHLTGRHFFIESSRRSAKRGQWIAKPRRKSLVRSIPPSGARQTPSVGPDTRPVSAHNLAARAPESQSHSRLSCGGYFLGHHPCDFRLSRRAAGSAFRSLNATTCCVSTPSRVASVIRFNQLPSNLRLLQCCMNAIAAALVPVPRCLGRLSRRSPPNSFSAPQQLVEINWATVLMLWLKKPGWFSGVPHGRDLL
jgi:hypothetical protein